MKYQPTLILSLLAIFFAGCSSMKIVSDVANETNFKTYKTFKLLEQKSDFPAAANPINRQRLAKAINLKMQELGYQESETPDLYVTFFVKKETKHSQGAISEYYDEWDYVDKFNVYQYKEGTLIVDLIDAEKQQVVWHGILQRVTDENINKAAERINKNVEKLFARFKKERSY